MRWSGATGAIARCKNRSTGYGRRGRSVHAWRWICGVKPTPKAVNKPSPHCIVHGLDKPGGFTKVSIFSPVRKCVVTPGRLDDIYTFLDQLAIDIILCHLAVPRAGGLRPLYRYIVLEPARLIATHEGDVEATAKHVVQGCGMFRHAQWVMRRENVTELVYAQTLGLHTHIHGHEAWILAQFKTLDLQVMFRDADTSVAGLVAQPGVCTYL